MRKIDPLEYGRYYHIYNRGINGTDLFLANENYLWFIKLYKKYIDIIADTFAWCLMKNHFHFLVRIKEEEEVSHLKPLSGNKTAERVSDSKTPTVVPNPIVWLIKNPDPYSGSHPCRWFFPKPLAGIFQLFTFAFLSLSLPLLLISQGINRIFICCFYGLVTYS